MALYKNVHQIHLSDGKSVYMHSDDMPEGYAVVWISVKKLLEIWHESQSFGNRKAEWFNKKYANTERSFSNCHDAPVPVSEVGRFFNFEMDNFRFKFNDGATRVRWLINHGAQSIPAGCPEGRIASFRQIGLLMDPPDENAQSG
ncbi:MAG: hypothetical protein LBB66_04470 [Desulfovibrio sp.]|jgi:hypothetical protein|nr:hypothetical protein [Desulfovibrio sp.]